MNEIVKGKNRAYARYEETLLRRDGLRQEAEQLHWQYMQLYGDMIERAFRLKVDCIQKKKMIAYCQQKVNKGERINGNALGDYIAKQMASYQQELEQLVRRVQAAKESKDISTRTCTRIMPGTRGCRNTGIASWSHTGTTS